MTNFVQDGAVILWANSTSTDVSAGDVVLVGTIVGIAITDIAAGASGSLKVTGVFTLAGAAGAWTQGDAVYWDASASDFTKTSSGNTKAGIAWADKASATTTGNVLINAGN